MSWNVVVLTGLVASALSIAMARGARAATAAGLRRRFSLCLWLVRAYGLLLLAGVVVPLVRFARLGEGGDPAARALQLGAAIAGGMNLILGFVVFGTAPAVVAIMLNRRLRARDDEPPPP